MTRCNVCCACQSVCPFISTDSGMPAVDQQISVCCDWMKHQGWSVASVSVWQHVEFSIPEISFMCCWDVKQPRTRKPLLGVHDGVKDLSYCPTFGFRGSSFTSQLDLPAQTLQTRVYGLPRNLIKRSARRSVFQESSEKGRKATTELYEGRRTPAW